MGKKRKPSRTASAEIQDKPDYAADWFRPQPKPEKKPKEDEAAQLRVEDRLAGSTAKKLVELKSRMESETKAANTEATAKKPVRRATSAAVDKDDDSKSFAELFNPQDDDTDDFEALLKDSKLDWKSFKE